VTKKIKFSALTAHRPAVTRYHLAQVEFHMCYVYW